MSEEDVATRVDTKLLIENTLFCIIIVPIIMIILILVWQRITQPEKIPDIFGYKMFIVLDGKMDESVSFGDLVFTKNISTDKLNTKNLIAFRNLNNTVTLHKILKINQDGESRSFLMQTAKNEIKDTEFVDEKNIEGIVIKKIARIGIILYLIQDPLIILFLIIVVLIIGLIVYYIAQELDKREEMNNT